MTMKALVLRVEPDRLLVLDFSTRQQVAVMTSNTRRFRQGNMVRIQYNGVMTMSIPPQISAQRIMILPFGAPGCGRC